MNVKEIWTEADFDEMGWHDSYIHAISFPDEDLNFTLDIDYLFEWALDKELNVYKFWVSPCKLVFSDVLNFKINLDFENTTGLDILDINRSNIRLSSVGKISLWDFEIETDKGYITFTSSGYRQIVKKQPILSQSQVLERNT